MRMKTIRKAAPIATAPQAVRAAVLGALLALTAGSASAACRDDLIKADQNINRTRSELQKAASAAAPVKCVAYRRHVASLTEVRNVFARCDTSADKAKNAAQTKSAIAEFTRQMRGSCKK